MQKIYLRPYYGWHLMHEWMLQLTSALKTAVLVKTSFWKTYGTVLPSNLYFFSRK